MKTLIRLTALASLTLLSACATQQAQMQIQTVGPDPAMASFGGNQGYLMVYSAWSRGNNEYAVDHSGYTVLNMDGKRVKWVPNYIEGNFDTEPPTRVALLAGTYDVSARSQAYGKVNVPVVIEGGRTTVVYLDGQNHKSVSQSDAPMVVLPDKEVIGFAANTR